MRGRVPREFGVVRDACVAPDASSGVARKTRNEVLTTAVALRNSDALTRRFAPRGGRGVRPYANGSADTA
jgi:hypothetical protein